MILTSHAFPHAETIVDAVGQAVAAKGYLCHPLGGGRAPGSDYFERRFAEANAECMNRLFGSGVTADDVLQHAKKAEPRSRFA